MFRIMKKNIRAFSIAMAIVCLLCFFQPHAIADLKRGSSGEAVTQLQQQLIDVGALDDSADGKFGKKTEKAVKDLQGYFGLKKNGKVNDRFKDELNLLWHTLNEEEISYTELSEEDMEKQGLYCYPTETEPEYCPRHAFLHSLEELLKRNGRKAPEGVQCVIYQRIVTLGYRDIMNMYDVWEERLNDSDKHIAGKQKEIFIESFERVFGVIWNYENLKPSLTSIGTWEDLYNWIMLTLVNECYDLYGQEANL